MTDKWKRQKDFSQQDIADRIKDFEHAQDIKVLALGMQIRYVSTDKTSNKRTLKMGGILVHIDPKGRYLKVKSMIPGNTKPWSVQITEDTEIYYKKMLKQDDKYQEVVKWAGSENNLRIIQQVLGESKEAQKYVKHIMKNFDGKLANLVEINKKTKKKLEEASKRIKYLEGKVKGKGKKTGMSMMSESN